MSDISQILNMSHADECLSLLACGIDRSVYSAAQLFVSDSQGVRMDVAQGTTLAPSVQNAYQKSMTIGHGTLFDVASLTKPLATAGLMMIAADEGRLSPEQKLVTFDDVLFPPWLLGATLGDLLSHHTMLEPWTDLSQWIPASENNRSSQVLAEQGIYRMEPRTGDAKYCYSDLGYMLLGFLLERLYGDSLAHLFEDRIARKLGLSKEMTFLPLHKVNKREIVATCLFHGRYVQGHPDDANARLLAHCAGHAGVFASARAIDAYMRSLFDGKFPCSRKTIDAFISYRHCETPYAMGWDRPATRDSLSGAPAGAPVIGHLGFTGCSVWYDLEKHRCVTLLTNRTHLDDDRAAINEIRRKICRLCWEA